MAPAHVDGDPVVAGPSSASTDDPDQKLLSASQASSTALPSTTRNSTSSSTSAATTATTTTAESSHPDPTPTKALSPPPPPPIQTLALQQLGRRQPSSPSTPSPHHLLALPPELLLMIFTHLDFASIVHLRRTCHALRTLASPQQLRTLIGPMAMQTLVFGSCKTCLSSDSTRSKMVIPSPSDPGYPLASQCITCSLISGDTRLTVDKRAPLGNFEMADSCRWCGWPVLEARTTRHCEDFHAKCANAYHRRLFCFFIMGWVQLSLGVTAAAMAWRWFRDVPLVFGPTVTTFLLLWVCIFSLILRGRKSGRGILVTMLVELAILALWIPPVYYLAREFQVMVEQGKPIPRSSTVTMAMFALNMVFRLLNVLGNLIVLCGYDMTRRHRPNPGMWRKMIHPLLSRLVFWTYPQSLQRKPGR